MSTSRALVSLYTAFTDQAFRADHLKLCFLWYDEVLFETLSQAELENRFFEGLVGEEDDARNTIKRLRDAIFPLNHRVDQDVIGSYLARSKGYPRWGPQHEYYTYPNPETGEEFAHNRLLKKIEAEFGVSRFEGWAVEQAEGRARVATEAVGLWARVNAEVPCTLQANSDEKLAMEAVQEFSANVSQLPLRLFEIVLPSLSSVSWREIVKLRLDGRLQSLRNKISVALQEASRDLDAATRLFKEIELAATEEAIESGRPRVKKIAIESLLANIPGLLVNPFSVFFGARDTKRAITNSRDLGWFYMLRDIKRVAERWFCRE